MNRLRAAWGLARRLRGRLLLCAAPVLLAVFGIRLVRAALELDPRGCIDDIGALPDYGLLETAGAALVGGRVLDRVRYQGQWPLTSDKRSGLVGIGALTLLFLGATGALLYEAIGLLGHPAPGRTASLK